MWKLATSQLRLQPRRYVAVLLAIVLGTMFLAGSLLVTSSAKETTKQMLGSTYANADLLISADNDVLWDEDTAFYDLAGTMDQPGSLEDLSGVQEVYPLASAATAWRYRRTQNNRVPITPTPIMFPRPTARMMPR